MEDAKNWAGARSVAKRYIVLPPLIAICHPYLKPARLARHNLSVELPFYLAQIKVNHEFCEFLSGTINYEKEIVTESA